MPRWLMRERIFSGGGEDEALEITAVCSSRGIVRSSAERLEVTHGPPHQSLGTFAVKCDELPETGSTRTAS